ncbi:ABC transporter permease [Paenibacillus physcomitrellae]|uniref:Glutathione ABC transporter permease n=1 Tax=Paenibacillus physcomitrellae TaxID=1619311 RepID=A0ABQ1GCN9_9BACL|nr:ABC transporter permease [Paenibacillus physcomitrellae]GGA41136.1 glutathione ABC transporter permease [Paenibacillus physcomitrellae]
MTGFIGKRLLMLIPTLLGVSIVVFLMLKIVPGDPVNSILPPDATETERAAIRTQMGLDKPIVMQYLLWLGGVLQGQLGDSVVRRLPVADLLLPALGNTILLTCAAAVFSFLISMVIGVFTAYYPKSKLASIFNGLSLAGIGMPNFWAALILIGIFSVMFGWFPSSGMKSVDGGGARDLVLHLVLPTIAAALASLGVMTRMIRSTVSGLLKQDFVFTLQAKGCSSFTILRHVLRNGMPAILNVAGLQFGYLIASSVLVETVFSWPGVGQVIYQAISQRDFPVVQAGVLIIAVMFVLINLVVDSVHAAMDPRVRQS